MKVKYKLALAIGLMVAGLVVLCGTPALRMASATEPIALCLALGIICLCGLSTYRFLSVRKPKWPIPIPILVLLLLAPMLYLTLMEDFDFDSRRNPLFQDAERAVKASDVSRADLGQPIRIGWPIAENSEESGDSGKATLAIPISGSRAKATLYVIGNKTNGNWKVDKMFFVIQGDKKRKSLASSEAPESPNLTQP